MAKAVRLLFAGGGTGGHLYPGLAVAAALRAVNPEVEIAFFVTRRAIDRQVLEGGPYAVQFEDARGFSLRPWHWPGFGLSLLVNLRRARRYLESFRPQAVIGLGGYGSYAAVRQAQKAGIANFILNPDLLMGRANRRLARRTTAVFCQFAETVAGVRSGGRVEVVGCPVRESLFGVDRQEACRSLGLDPLKKTLVVTGASLGARSINRAFVIMADRWRQFPDWQILHLTGRDLYADVRKAVGEAGSFYHVRDYVEEMGRVYAAADIVVARAGAGTVAEITALGLPSVLMPYPFHRDRHQERHAMLLQNAGAAVMVHDRVNAEENCEALWRVLPQMMEDEGRRRAMSEAAGRLGHPRAARSVAMAVLGAVGGAG